jgi:hypothetical protein
MPPAHQAGGSPLDKFGVRHSCGSKKIVNYEFHAYTFSYFINNIKIYDKILTINNPL